MLVELDAFSGRPNPRWELTASEAAEVTRLISGLSLAPEAPAREPPGLGYRGFMLKGPAGEDYRVLRGIVRTRDRILADPTRSLERYLIEHLPGPFQDIQSWLKGEIASD